MNLPGLGAQRGSLPQCGRRDLWRLGARWEEWFRRQTHAQLGEQLFLGSEQMHVSIGGGDRLVEYYGLGLRPTPGLLFIGAGEDGLDRFNGRVDEVALWKRSLRPSELQAIYNNGRGRRYPLACNMATTRIKVVSDTDTDGDGLLDMWEQQHFGNLGQDNV